MILPHRAQFGIRHNYRFIQATEKQIAKFLFHCGKFEKIPANYDQILHSLRTNGWASKLWTQITREYIPSFALVREYHNIVPSVLRDELATLISGTTVTPTFKANYFALGTGSNVPANSDTALQTETLRAAFTDRSSYTNIAYLDVFFPTASVAGNTYNEAGIFVDGSAGANTGYLLSRVAINQTLGSSQTLTVNCSITIS